MDGSTWTLDLISGSNTTAQQLCAQIIEVKFFIFKFLRLLFSHVNQFLEARTP